MASGIFSAPEIGSAQAVGVKNNGIKEYTHDIIYPVSDIRTYTHTTAPVSQWCVRQLTPTMEVLRCG